MPKDKKKKPNWKDKLIDNLIAPLMNTYKFIFITLNYELTERQMINLMYDEVFNEKFELCIKQSLKDYTNQSLSPSELLNDIKFNLSYLFSYIDSQLERKCLD